MERPQWFEFPRESPEYAVTLYGERHVFTYHNVKVCVFPEEFKQFNHIFYTHDEKYTYIFNSQTCMDELHDFGFPMIYEPWPSEQDVEAYIQSEIQDL